MVTSQIRNGHELTGRTSPLALVARWSLYLVLFPFAALAVALWLAAPRSEFGKFACMVAAVGAFLSLVIAFDLPLPH